MSEIFGRGPSGGQSSGRGGKEGNVTRARGHVHLSFQSAHIKAHILNHSFKEYKYSAQGTEF